MGDQAIVAQFENKLSLQVSRSVQSFAHLIKKSELIGIKHLLPAFNNLTICYDPTIIEYHKLIDKLRSLEEISRRSGLSSEEVIKLLHSKPYFVYMIGFIAGYPYCGDIDERLALPRRSNPRIKVKKGTIQIVNQQTGIFTITAPSGWHLVGWTPMEMFNPNVDPPSMFRGGDYVQYIPIDAGEAENWNEQRQREWDQKWNSLK